MVYVYVSLNMVYDVGYDVKYDFKYDLTWHNMIWYGMMWYDVMRYNMIWNGKINYDMIWGEICEEIKNNIEDERYYNDIYMLYCILYS